jgi:hypothetical protein
MSTDAEEAGRAQARQLEADSPLWIVAFGVSSKEFACFSRASVPFRAFLVARDLATLPPRMRRAESSPNEYQRPPNGRMCSPAALPSPEKSETHS